MLLLFCAVMSMVVCGPLGKWVAEQKGRRPSEGMMLGIGIGVFGVLIECLLPTDGAGIVRHKETKAEAVEKEQRRHEVVARHMRAERVRVAALRAAEFEAAVQRREVFMEATAGLREVLKPILAGLAVALPLVFVVAWMFRR